MGQHPYPPLFSVANRKMTFFEFFSGKGGHGAGSGARPPNNFRQTPLARQSPVDPGLCHPAAPFEWETAI